jgi:MYXO-CTERM domain-containing protein
MAANDYHFVSNWRVRGSVEEVFDIVSDSESLATLWPAAFLDVVAEEPGDPNGLGKVVRLETRGWLPYKLHWRLRVDQRERPHGFSFAVWGDFEGRGSWTFIQDGEWTNVGYDWQVRVHKPLVSQLSFLLKPLFGSNHRWAMAKGEESLRLALARQKITDPAQQAAIPPPPGPVSYPDALFLGVVALLGIVLLRRRKRPPAS